MGFLTLQQGLQAAAWVQLDHLIAFATAALQAATAVQLRRLREERNAADRLRSSEEDAREERGRNVP